MKNQHFNINTDGRDFVCGDLHGSFDLLTSFLSYINFDGSKDRMFSVGDLIDRGPDSLFCLKLLDKPWFHPVKANHEQLMEDWMTGGPTGSWWRMNGGGWYDSLVKQNQEEVNGMLGQVQNMPWAITVDLPDNKRFHVIHAEIFGIKGEKITDDDFLDPIKFQEIASRQCADGHSLLWGRELFRDLYAKETTEHGRSLHKAVLKKWGVTDFFNQELSHIYSGHTPVVEATTICGQTNLDNMAFAVDKRSWAGLTVVEPLTNTFWKTNNEGTHEVQPVVL